MPSSRKEKINSYMEQTAEIYGIDDPTVVNEIEPAIAQRRETRIQNSNDFLKKVTVMPVYERSADILSFGVPHSLMKRTSQSSPEWGKRRPTNPNYLLQREFKTHDCESDAHVSWALIDSWPDDFDFYPAWSDHVDIARAADRLKVAWQGQYRAEDSDPDKDLKDIQAGWIQYLIETAPEQVMGIIPDAAEDFGYRVEPIQVGPTANSDGFRSVDALASYMRANTLHKHFRKKKDVRALVGDNLVSKDTLELHGRDLDPSERIALTLWLSDQKVGNIQTEESDEFPDGALWLSSLDMLAYYYRADTMRRKIKEEHKQKGVVDYWYGEEDFPISVAEGAACTHPDAIVMYNKTTDTWEPAGSEAWKVEL